MTQPHGHHLWIGIHRIQKTAPEDAVFKYQRDAPSAYCARSWQPRHADSIKLFVGSTALVATLARILLGTRRRAASAADLLTTASSRQALAIGQGWLGGELAVGFRNDLIAHARTSQ